MTCQGTNTQYQEPQSGDFCTFEPVSYNFTLLQQNNPD